VASGPGPTGQYCRPLAAPLPPWAMATGTLSAVGHAVGHGVRCIFLQTLGRPIIFENRDKLNIKKIRSIYYKRALASRLDNMFWAQMGGTHSCRQTSDAPHLPHLSVFPSSLSLSLCPLIARRRWCREPCAGLEGDVGLRVVEQGGARRRRRVEVEERRAGPRRRRGGVYSPSILPLPHSLLLHFS
jgi:hypothetical protein